MLRSDLLCVRGVVTLLRVLLRGCTLRVGVCLVGAVRVCVFGATVRCAGAELRCGVALRRGVTVR